MTQFTLFFSLYSLYLLFGIVEEKWFTDGQNTSQVLFFAYDTWFLFFPFCFLLLLLFIIYFLFPSSFPYSSLVLLFPPLFPCVCMCVSQTLLLLLS